MQVIPNEIYTLKEVEKILKLSRSTVQRLIKNGTLKTVKIGRQHRIFGKSIIKMAQQPKGINN